MLVGWFSNLLGALINRNRVPSKTEQMKGSNNFNTACKKGQAVQLVQFQPVLCNLGTKFLRLSSSPFHLL